MPVFDNQRNRNVPIEQFAGAATFVRQLAAESHDIALEGATEGPLAARQIAPYANAGMTWWIEALGWWRGGRPAEGVASQQRPCAGLPGAGPISGEPLRRHTRPLPAAKRSGASRGLDRDKTR
jgi:hypothetical protein